MTDGVPGRRRSAWADEVVARTEAAFVPMADPAAAAPMAAYMKNVAPFLGIPAEPRRRAQRTAWEGLAAPTSAELGAAARALVGMHEREYHYAASDLIGLHVATADDRFPADEFLAGALPADAFLVDHVEPLLTTVPWWDTVDALGTAAVSPLCRHSGDHARGVIARWSASGDRWLVRAAIQHQRGWKAATEIDTVLGLCHTHAGAREFFVVKAIGWALRDLAALDPAAVRTFLDEHPALGAVAVREAAKGLARAGVSS